MYESYWGLRETPFVAADAPRHPFRSAATREALARLQFMADSGWRLGLLLGEGGIGKSVVLATLAAELRRPLVRVVLLNLVHIEPRDFLWQLAAGLNTNPQRDATPFELWRFIDDELRSRRFQRVATVVLADDADRAPPETLDEVLRLTRCDAAGDARLTIVLAARPDRLRRLGGELLELSDLRIDLEAWDRDEIDRFLTSELSRTGRDERVFAADSIDRIAELSRGRPRRVAQLATLALVAGAGLRLAEIDAETILSVHQELEVQPAGALSG